MANNLQPVMLAEKVYDYIQSTTLKMMPWERYAVLSFDSCILTPAKNTKLIKCTFGNDLKNADDYSSLHCIIVQLSYLHNKIAFPIAVIYCNESFNAGTVAHIICGIMHDLLMLSVRIIATVCAPTEQFIQVVSHLCFVTKEDVCASDKLTYTIGAVGTFGLPVVHMFDFEIVLSQIRDIFTKVDFEFEDNGQRCTASFAEIYEFMNHLPEEVRHEFISFKSSQIAPMRKLFNLELTSKMRLHIANGLSNLSSHTERFCEFFAQAIVMMQKPMHGGNKGGMRKSFYKTIAVLDSMVLIRPNNNIFHDKFIDNITKVPDSIISNRGNEDNSSHLQRFEAAQLSALNQSLEDDNTYCTANISSLNDDGNANVPDVINKKYFRCFCLNFAMQAVNGVSVIYSSVERHNVLRIKLKTISLISLRENIRLIQKAFDDGGVEHLKSTKLDPIIVNVICEAFYNGFKVPANQN